MDKKAETSGKQIFLELEAIQNLFETFGIDFKGITLDNSMTLRNEFRALMEKSATDQTDTLYQSLKGKTSEMRAEIIEKMTDENLQKIARIEYADPIRGFNQGAIQKSIWRELFKRTGYLGHKQLTGRPSSRQREYLKTIGIIWKYNR